MWGILFASLPTFLGAALAFLFGLVLYSLQKKTENGQYLSYTISILASQISNLYTLKKDIAQERNIEIQTIESEFGNIGKHDVHIQCKHISKYITNGQNHNLPVDLEKLSFLSNYDPNLLTLARTAINAGTDVDQIIETCNLEITRVRSIEYQPHDIYMLAQMNKQLIEQIDYALNLTEHLQSVLIDFSNLEFSSYTIIKEVTLEESYSDFKPTNKLSWHEIKYSKKQKYFKNVFKRMRRLIEV